jgi:two-component system, chemotaxis family, CheB/CheR fusion protein
VMSIKDKEVEKAKNTLSNRTTRSKKKSAQEKKNSSNIRPSKVSNLPKNNVETPFIYGIGSSAGGLDALRDLFTHIKANGICAFVVVQHMSPTSKSMLAELLARETQLPVSEVTDRLIPQAGSVYIVPPNSDAIYIDGRIQLEDIEKRIGPKPSIDKFFKSLALECGSKCGGIILSGTGSDGSTGLRFIAEAGGVTMIQDPDTAKYDGMPRSAMSRIAADFISGPLGMAQRLNHQSDNDSFAKSAVSDLYRDDPYKAIIELLRHYSKIDFSFYNRQTVLRRIQRAMDNERIRDIKMFVKYLEDNPESLPTLLKDILITVTEFFRDRDHFNRFQTVLLDYLRLNPEQRNLRIWCAGCSTGQEAYSLAIAGIEAFKILKRGKTQVQVFATDISEDSMATARKGCFSKEALDEMDPNLRKEYFQWVDKEYRIDKNVRDSILFARHDLTCDPPFMKMDVISCRNVFIYLDKKIQDRIMQVFHYALKPGGIMFLGKSENLGSCKAFFTSSDTKSRVFVKIDRPSSPDIRFSHLKIIGTDSHNQKIPAKIANKDVILKEFIKDCFPNSLVVDEAFSIRSIHGTARDYLRFPDGEFEQSLQKLLNQQLKSRVFSLLHRAKRSTKPLRNEKIDFQCDGKIQNVIIDVYPITNEGQFFWILSFHAPSPFTENANTPAGDSEYYKALEIDLASTREHLQTVIEEQETANEELQALNEELQSTNEELQSTNEELETSNEELQSTNEELVTVNQELNVKTVELREITHHLTLILNAISNPILVFDQNLCLIHYNALARRVIGIDANAIARNLRLIDSPILNSEILDFIEHSFRHGKQNSKHIISRDYEFDIQTEPINNSMGLPNGLVVNFTDNTKISRAFRAAQAAESRLISILAEIPAKIAVKDSQGRYTYANPEFCRITQLSMDDIIGSTDKDLFGASLGEQRRSRDLECLKQKSVLYSEETHTDNNQQKVVYHNARVPLVDNCGSINFVCSVGIDISQRVDQESKLQCIQNAIASAKDGFAVFTQVEDDFELQFASRSWHEMLGENQERLYNMPLTNFLSKFLVQQTEKQIEELKNEILSNDYHSTFVEQYTQEGELCFNFRSYKVEDDGHAQIFLAVFDITNDAHNEAMLNHHQQELLKASKLSALGEMAAGIGHELKTPLNTIQGYVDLVYELYKQGLHADNSIMEAVSHIEETVADISNIIVSLKSISKNKKEETFTLIDIQDVVKDVQRVCSLHLKNKGIRLSWHLPTRKVLIEAKPSQLTQVLINLINNAVEAISNLKDKWINAEFKMKDEELYIRLTDSGFGIPEPVASKIMTPFFTTKADGTGLGLSLSKNIILMHSGELSLDTKSPHTSFVIRLPLKQGQRPQPG